MGLGDPAADHLGLLRTPGALFRRVAMACDAFSRAQPAIGNAKQPTWPVPDLSHSHRLQQPFPTLRSEPMSPSPLLVRPPAPANPSLPSRRYAPAVTAAAAAAAVCTTPASSSVAPFSRLRTNCRFAASDVRDDYSSSPIDIVVDVKTEKIVVLGGSGFVGSAICRAAVSKGIETVSLSRSGRPSYSDPWVDQVIWLAGDVFYARWDEVLVGATAVVSTLGGFGNDEQMKRINGEANVIAVDAAKEYGVPKFILISVHDYNLPSFLLTSGYFTGKRKAESEVLSKYPASGVVLRPGFIYGKRKVNGFEIPLDVVGQVANQ